MANTIPAAHPSTVNMNKGVFNCRTCNIEFSSCQTWRAHAKSDAHVSNLKERVASSGVVLPSAMARQDAWNKHGWPSAQMPNGTHDSFHHPIPSGKSDESVSGGDSDTARDSTPDFIPDQCLFCGTLSGTFAQNLHHMAQTHSFHIPSPESLIVQVETLIWYLHLVIYGYQECPLCSRTKRSVEGIQQHMTAKAHCRFEINGHMGDFYQVSKHRPEDMMVAGESTMRLPSGKILGQRTVATASSRRAPTRSKPQQAIQSDNVAEKAASALVTRNDRAVARLASQVSRFRASDQQSLSRLPADELRSVLASRVKQLSSARRGERKMRARLEAGGNKTLMRHFKPDVPGRLNG